MLLILSADEKVEALLCNGAAQVRSLLGIHTQVILRRWLALGKRAQPDDGGQDSAGQRWFWMFPVTLQRSGPGRQGLRPEVGVFHLRFLGGWPGRWMAVFSTLSPQLLSAWGRDPPAPSGRAGSRNPRVAGRGRSPSAPPEWAGFRAAAVSSFRVGCPFVKLFSYSFPSAFQSGP